MRRSALSRGALCPSLASVQLSSSNFTAHRRRRIARLGAFDVVEADSCLTIHCLYLDFGRDSWLQRMRRSERCCPMPTLAVQRCVLGRTCVLGVSLVSGVTAMSTSEHWLVQRHSNFANNENIHLLKQSCRGRVVGGLGGAGIEVQ
jgi:hypothetical protein